MVALYILENTFAEQEDEWKLIAKKAQKYLQTDQGIEKVDQYIKKIKITLK